MSGGTTPRARELTFNVSSSQTDQVRLGAFAAGRHAMEATALAGSVLVIAGAIVWSMLNARERSRPE